LLSAISKFEPAAGSGRAQRDNGAACGDGPKGEAKPGHPARPTNVKKRPKGAFLLSAFCQPAGYQVLHLSVDNCALAI